MKPLEPIQILEIEQPRCGLRFGVGACPATPADGPPCYQVWGTCPVKESFDPTASIRWRFMSPRPGQWFFGDFSDEDNIATHAIFAERMSISSYSGEINVAGILEGKTAFGVLSRSTTKMMDPVWDDRWGDFYLADRPSDREFSFWEVWTTRNPFYSDIRVNKYDGYVGQTLDEMRKTVHILESVDGPDSSGQVTINAKDPSHLLEAGKAKYPPASNIVLTEALIPDAVNIKVRVMDIRDLDRPLSNRPNRFLRIGDEILSYTGYTELETGIYQLTGVQRGVLGTTRTSARAEDRCQRVAKFFEWPVWKMAKEIIENSPIPLSFFDFDAWEEEAVIWLQGIQSSPIIPEPIDQLQLLAECCQQGMFYIWWSEEDQQFRFESLKPPQGDVPLLTDNGNLLKDSVSLVREPSARVTRVLVYYSPRNPLLRDAANFRRVRGRVEGSNESEAAGGIIKERIIFARFVESDLHAYQLASRILSRYRGMPEFLLFSVDMKDRTLTMGSVTDVLTKQIKTSEGVPAARRWQVIRFDEVRHGEVYALKCQSYELFGRYAYWMADDAPDYLSASDAQRKRGFFWSNDEGKMSNGDEGYKWQ